VKDEEKEEQRRKEVDADIHYVVSKYIKTIGIVIQGEAEAGCRPVKFTGTGRIGIKGRNKSVPCDSAHVQIGVFRDIGFIVELPCAVQGIAVDGDYKDCQGQNGKNDLSAV